MLSAYPLQEKELEMRISRLALNENEKAQEPYTVTYEGKEFIVYPGVFSPKIFPDTYFFADHISITPQEVFLEVGSGMGLISVMAALRGANQVFATELNQVAIANTLENSVKHNVGDKVIIRYENSVFEGLLPGEKFDTIWWNTPFMHIEKQKSELSLLEKALYDPNYQSLQTYFSQARKWLKPSGRLLVGFSCTHGHKEILELIAEKYGWTLYVIAEKTCSIKSFQEELPFYQISTQLFQAFSR